METRATTQVVFKEVVFVLGNVFRTTKKVVSNFQEGSFQEGSFQEGSFCLGKSLNEFFVKQNLSLNKFSFRGSFHLPSSSSLLLLSIN